MIGTVKEGREMAGMIGVEWAGEGTGEEGKTGVEWEICGVEEIGIVETGMEGTAGMMAAVGVTEVANLAAVQEDGKIGKGQMGGTLGPEGRLGTGILTSDTVTQVARYVCATASKANIQFISH